MSNQDVNKPVYLDYAATTPVDPAVADIMARYLTEEYGNPASRQHAWGRAAADAVEQARAQVASLLGAEPAEIIWTSGATESNNLAIKGTAEAHADRSRHLVTVKTEHKSVIDCYRQLEQRGWRVTWLLPDKAGLVSPQQIGEALSDDTVLLSVMAVNNETGVIQDIESIGRITRERGVLLHVDAAQALGKLPVDVNAWQADLVSASAHKCYGPKGIGALYVRRRPHARIQAQMHGGGHERGLRSGTLATHQIAGFGKACEVSGAKLDAEMPRIAALRDRLWAGLEDLPQIFRNGSAEHCAPNFLNVSIAGVDGEALHAGLSTTLALSSGSACTAATQESSYVLRALGRDDELAYASLRVSLGRWTSEADIDTAIERITAHVTRLRQLSPLEPAGAYSVVPPQAREGRMSHPDYSDAVWSHFLDDSHVGCWPAGPEVITARMQTPGSRAVMQVQLRLADERVVESCFQVYGCVSAIACGAWLAGWLEGRTLAELQGLKSAEIDAQLELAPIKRHCAVMAEDAVQTLAGEWGQMNTGQIEATG